MKTRSLVAGLAAAALLMGALADIAAGAEPFPREEAPQEVLDAVSRAMEGAPEAVSAAAAPLPDESAAPFGDLILRVGGVLVFILGLLYVSLLGMKRMAGRARPAHGEQIRVLGRTPLSGKANVYLLRLRDRYLVVGEAGGQLTALGSLPAQDDSAGEDASEGVTNQSGEGFPGFPHRQQAFLAAEGTLRRITEGVKKLRQETENLLNIPDSGTCGSRIEVASSPRQAAKKRSPVGAEVR